MARPIVNNQRALRLALLHCRRHHAKPAAIFAFHAAELRCWCCPACAARDGWPWLASEPAKASKGRKL